MTATRKGYVMVVGMDYSKSADLALDAALELASSRADAEVHVVNVAQALPVSPYGFAVSGVFPPDYEFANLTTHVQRRVEEWTAARQVSLHPFTRVICHLRRDAVAEQIAQTAADLEADLVLVGTHGRRGAARLLLGSVAESTVRLAPCPVLVVRPKAIPEALPRIEPPCPRCVEARVASEGKVLWCAQHLERHGQRHTYHQGDRASADSNFPLVCRQ